MDSTQAALVVFFGIFWAAALSAVAPYQTFDTRMLFRKGERWRGAWRLCAGLVIVNVLPVAGLVLLLKSPLMDAKQVRGVAVAAIASLAVFSVQRFLHAVVATRPFFKYFYSPEEVQGLKDRKKTVDGFKEHFFPGIGYAVVPLVAAWVVAVSTCSPGPKSTSRDVVLAAPVVQGTGGTATPVRQLSPNEVLLWRDKYADLLGKSKDALLERYGPSTDSEGERTLNWGASEKTGNRSVAAVLNSDANDAIVVAIKVYTRDADHLDPIEIIKQALLFDFKSGAFEDSVTNYFVATTKDRRNAFQFRVEDDGVFFERAVFMDPKNLDAMTK